MAIDLYKVGIWNRATVADGKKLNFNTIFPLSANCVILANHLSGISGTANEDSVNAQSVYNTVSSNSGDWVNFVDELYPNIDIWNDTRETVVNNSGEWSDSYVYTQSKTPFLNSITDTFSYWEGDIDSSIVTIDQNSAQWNENNEYTLNIYFNWEVSGIPDEENFPDYAFKTSHPMLIQSGCFIEAEIYDKQNNSSYIVPGSKRSILPNVSSLIYGTIVGYWRDGNLKTPKGNGDSIVLRKKFEGDEYDTRASNEYFREYYEGFEQNLRDNISEINFIASPPVIKANKNYEFFFGYDGAGTTSYPDPTDRIMYPMYIDFPINILPPNRKINFNIYASADNYNHFVFDLWTSASPMCNWYGEQDDYDGAGNWGSTLVFLDSISRPTYTGNHGATLGHRVYNFQPQSGNSYRYNLAQSNSISLASFNDPANHNNFSAYYKLNGVIRTYKNEPRQTPSQNGRYHQTIFLDASYEFH